MNITGTQFHNNESCWHNFTLFKMNPNLSINLNIVGMLNYLDHVYHIESKLQ